MYKTYRECAENLAGVRAIDFFFAKECLGQISNSTKFSKDDKEILFYLLVKLMSAYSLGHSCIKITDVANKVLFSSKEEQKQGFIFPKDIEIISILDSLNYSKLPIFFAKEFNSLYIKRLWLFESEIAEFIKDKINTKSIENIEQIITKLFDKTEQVNWQKEAVKKSLQSDFSIISGGPGTGKTTTVAKLLLAIQMQSDKPKIALLAPTGKAAQRLTESLNISKKNFKNTLNIDENLYSVLELEGQTIHRFLGLRPNSTYSKYNQETKAPFDVIVVDEASMLDINIFIKLIRAVGENTKLILLGDINQLPSVEVGSLLASFTDDLDGTIELISEYTTKLLKNYRSQQNINNLANDILTGTINIQQHQNENVCFTPFKNIDKKLKEYASRYKKLAGLNSYQQALEELKKLRILVANRNLEIGTNRLNQKIEKLLGKTPSSNYHAKPIMIIENSYSTGLFNGDIGILWQDNNGVLKAYFETKDKPILINMLPKFETVYAMTVHKTQGSEFDEVVMILPKESNNALTRELLYTGITRAKTKLEIVSDTEILKDTINKKVVRNSNMTSLLSRSVY